VRHHGRAQRRPSRFGAVAGLDLVHVEEGEHAERFERELDAAARPGRNGAARHAAAHDGQAPRTRHRVEGAEKIEHARVVEAHVAQHQLDAAFDLFQGLGD